MTKSVTSLFLLICFGDGRTSSEGVSFCLLFVLCDCFIIIDNYSLYFLVSSLIGEWNYSSTIKSILTLNYKEITLLLNSLHRLTSLPHSINLLTPSQKIRPSWSRFRNYNFVLNVRVPSTPYQLPTSYLSFYLSPHLPLDDVGWSPRFFEPVQSKSIGEGNVLLIERNRGPRFTAIVARIVLSVFIRGV